MIIEICANSYESALIAEKAGASRIELCTQLSVGGLTPSYGLIERVTESLEIPVHVLIRPRAGGFVYSKDDLEIMRKDILICEELNCAGVVSGVLTSNNDLDEEATKWLVAAAKRMEFTFHRAIDLVQNPEKTLQQLLEMGVTRVLSSGQQLKAIDGMSLLKEWKNLMKNKIQIMPGSGINVSNAMLFKEAGFDMIHFSAQGISVSEIESPTVVTFTKDREGVSQIDVIQEIMKLVRN